VTTTRSRSKRRIDPRLARFAGQTASELAWPITAAVVATSDLERRAPELDDELRRKVDAVSRNLSEITSLLDEFQALATLEEIPLDLDLEAVSLRTFLADTIRTFHERASRSNVVLSCREDVLVDLDVRWFQRALNGLLRYGARGPDRTISISVYRAPTLAIVAIHSYADRPGTANKPAEDAGVRREDEPRTADDWSLHVAQIVVEAHQGTMWSDTSVRHGAKFLMTLPTTEIGVGDGTTL
jgi:signal transduction histidine kinase